ncbi:alkaline phosphatase family protein [Actinotalea sp. Marseille-Q4924]|uniref:alkaline phosphatase family protein n=1 Tax=Actinotalea sp. Marseille-Q4924 TaxID=2866571 RepID=UPI001CE43829|nr:alkaline phosphatase family protein [Actinotalea sp. Marseille-Q4924]
MRAPADVLDAAGLVLPDYGGLCLDRVLPAALGALGAPTPAEVGDAEEARRRLGVPTADRVVVVLVDGLGHRMLAERAGHAPFLRRLLPHARVLTCGFPSTTASSMGLFGTGHGTGRTGLAGYTVRNPVDGALANLVAWQGAGEPRSWQRRPSLLAHAAEQGVVVHSVGPAAFAGSGLTEAALHGARYLGAESLEARVDATLRVLRTGPGLVYLYWGQVDKVGHQQGWRSAQWGDELAAADAELGRLARSVPGGTVLMITADHGMVDVDPARLLDVAAEPALRRDVEVVAGEPRAVHVHTVPGAAGAVADRWRERLGDAAVVLERSEAVAAGLFGEVDAHVEPVLGDVVVAATGTGGIADSRTQTPHSLLLRGMHGSLTAGEMEIPLLVVA